MSDSSNVERPGTDRGAGTSSAATIDGHAGDDRLHSRLDAIESRSLGDRADQYHALHDEVRDMLESGDSPQPGS